MKVGKLLHTRYRLNDLERSVKFYKEILGLEVLMDMGWIKTYGSSAKMTGTGACVFAEVSDKRAGESVLAQLPAQRRGFLVRSVNRSPLLDRLAEEGRA